MDSPVTSIPPAGKPRFQKVGDNLLIDSGVFEESEIEFFSLPSMKVMLRTAVWQKEHRFGPSPDGLMLNIKDYQSIAFESTLAKYTDTRNIREMERPAVILCRDVIHTNALHFCPGTLMFACKNSEVYNDLKTCLQRPS